MLTVETIVATLRYTWVDTVPTPFEPLNEITLPMLEVTESESGCSRFHADVDRKLFFLSTSLRGSTSVIDKKKKVFGFF